MVMREYCSDKKDCDDRKYCNNDGKYCNDVSSLVNDGIGGVLCLSQKAQKATFFILDVFMPT